MPIGCLAKDEKMKAVVALVLFLSGSLASAKVLKTWHCEGATLQADIAVQAEPHEPALVTWEILDKESGYSENFVGYLFTENNLQEFSSTDMGSDLEISGSVALLSFRDKEETLLCR